MTIFSNEARKAISSYIENNENRIELNSKLFTILEGQLAPLLEQKLKEDLGASSAARAVSRKSPINYYRKVIDKLTTIYYQGVVRKVVNGTDSDQELLEWYEKELHINDKLNSNNENLNAYKYSLAQISLGEPQPMTNSRKPFLRSIPNHEFLVMNLSIVNPTSPDVIILFMGEKEDALGKKISVYHVYSKDQFMIIDGDGEILLDEMELLGFEDGLNSYGVDPFIYANMSKNLVMPLTQSDDFDMALLVPVLLTDLNYSVKFQAFSMFVAINMDDADIKISPDSVLHLKSETEGEGASFNTIKPTVDINEVLTLSSSQISLWLSSKGIRPGTIGDLSGDQFASGISKMIDESDTFESRKKQIEIYKVFERELWDKTLKVFHPEWVNAGVIDNRTLFSPNAEVVTEFPIPKPMQTRMEVLAELKAAIDSRLESRKGALAELHPDWSEEMIEEKLAEIDAEKTFDNMFSNEEMIEEENGAE